MKKHCHTLVGLVFLALGASQVGAVTLSVLPSAQTAAPGDSISLDLVIDGLSASGPDSLGTFDINIAFDPGALSLTGFALDSFLGDLALGEALDLSLGDLGGGVVNVAEVSLLETDAPTCIFCIPPFLDDIQPASFRLANFMFAVDVLTPGSFTTVSITSSVIGDGFGMALPLDATFGAVISNPQGAVPEPGAFLLLVTGLFALIILRKGRLEITPR